MSAHFSKVATLVVVVLVASMFPQLAQAGKFGISIGVGGAMIRSNLHRPKLSSHGPKYQQHRSYRPQAAAPAVSQPAPAAPAQVVTSQTLDTGPATPPSPSTDLLLEDVQFVEPATTLVGPAYRVKFRNQGVAAVGNFRVELVAAANGKPSVDAPRATAEVVELAAGEAGEVTMRLPKSAVTGYSHLVVVLDSDAAVNDSDKTNNVVTVERAGLEGTADQKVAAY